VSRAALPPMTDPAAGRATRPSYAERWAALPRHYQWLAGFAAFLVLFFVWWDMIVPMGDRWALEAQRIEADLAEVAESGTLAASVDRKRALLQNLGPVSPPALLGKASTDLQRIAAEVADGCESVDDSKFSLGSPRRLPRTLSDAVLRDDARFKGRGGADPRLVILTGELSFTATPQDAIAIIRDLESMEEIETLSVVRMVKEDGRRVSVNLTLESWAVELRRP